MLPKPAAPWGFSNPPNSKPRCPYYQRGPDEPPKVPQGPSPQISWYWVQKARLIFWGGLILTSVFGNSDPLGVAFRSPRELLLLGGTRPSTHYILYQCYLRGDPRCLRSPVSTSPSPGTCSGIGPLAGLSWHIFCGAGPNTRPAVFQQPTLTPARGQAASRLLAGRARDSFMLVQGRTVKGMACPSAAFWHLLTSASDDKCADAYN